MSVCGSTFALRGVVLCCSGYLTAIPFTFGYPLQHQMNVRVKHVLSYYTYVPMLNGVFVFVCVCRTSNETCQKMRFTINQQPFVVFLFSQMNVFLGLNSQLTSHIGIIIVLNSKFEHFYVERSVH